MKIQRARSTMRNVVRSMVVAAGCGLGLGMLGAGAQTQPAAVPVPFASPAAGNGTPGTVSATCTLALQDTEGVSYGDNCPATQAVLSSPQGAAVDKYGNLYVADYSHRQVRVVYNGGANLAAAIVAANSNYTPASHALTPFTPTVGSIYTLAGTGAAITALTANAAGAYPCANNAASATAGTNSLGDGCPGAGATVGPRAVSLDKDGNVFITDYTNSRIRVLCVNCAAGTLAAGLITLENAGVTPVNGNIYTIAGYTVGYRDQAAGYSSANPGAVNATSAATISTALLRSPTQAVESSSDDVFIADNLNNAVRVLYNGGTAAKNILVAEGYTPVAGSLYTIAGAGCASTSIGNGKTGASAASNSCLTTVGSETPGLGTVPGSTVTASTGGVGTGPVWSVYQDPNGNVFYSDATNQRVKVLYAGIAAPLSLATATLQTGYTYSFAGQGSATANGVAPSGIGLTSAQSVGGDAAGNIFFADYSTGLLYETFAQTAITAIIGGGNAIATGAAGANCNGGATGPTMIDTQYNGCPTTQVKFSGPRGPIVSDNAGNLYFGDSPAYFLRRFSYKPTFPATTVAATSAAQSYAFTFLSAQTLTTPTFTFHGASGLDFADVPASDTCTSGLAVTGGSPGTTCVVYATFTPSAPGLRTGSAQVTSAAGVLGAQSLSGIGLGAGLNVDPGILASFASTATDPYNGIAVDGSGRVLVSDLTSKSVLRYTGLGSSVATVATGFTTPAGVAVDGIGNVFVADTTANTVTEIPVIGGTKFTLAAGLNAPRALATDAFGNLFVADTSNNRVLQYGPGATLPVVLGFTGLSAPQAVATDSLGNVYAADGTHILELSPTGVQSTIATGAAYTGLAVDPAGNVLASTGTTLLEYTLGNTAGTTIRTGLTSVRSVAIDSSGNLFLADPGVVGYFQLMRTLGGYTFATSPASTLLTLTSSGNAALTAPTYTQTDSTDFAVVPATTNPCSGALPAGVNCQLNATFNPTTAGTLTDYVTFSSNAVNASTVNIRLAGAAASQTTTIAATVSPATLVYGNAETLSATVTGSLQNPSVGTVNFYNGATLLGSGAVTGGKASFSFVPGAGTYSVTATYVPGTPAYSTSTTATAQTFAVTAAPLTVTANNASRLFGAANPAFTYSITGFVNNDIQASATTGAPSENTTATPTSPSGTYPITILQGTLAAPNYTFNFVNGTLSVTGATAQTITFGALPAVTYGAAPITLTATASSGLAVGYTVTGPATVSGSTLTLTGAGTVAVTANQTGNNTYQAAPSVTQSFTVGKAALTVTATSMSRTYGAANAALTYTVTGFAYSDTQVTATTGAPAESTTATAGSGVGTYPIAIAPGTLAAPNYTFSFTNGSLTVNPATLTLTANSATRAYGTANPTFSGTLSGAVNNDVLTETFATTATVASPVATYPIVPGVSGANAANYTVAATSGTLTITQVKPAIVLTASPTSGFNNTTTITLTATLSAPFGAPTGTVIFLQGGLQIGMAAITGNTAVIALTTLAVGPDTITAQYNGDTNFTMAASNSATVTIAAGFGVTSSATALAFQPNYQEAQAFLTVNPGGRTDTLTFACTGLPARVSCAFTPGTLALSGVTTAQTVQLLVSNSGATASLRAQPAPGSALGARTVALASLPLAGLLLLGLRRRRSLPLLLAVLLLGGLAGLSGCGTSPTATEQGSGSYTFNVTVNSGTTTLQTIPFTLSVP